MKMRNLIVTAVLMCAMPAWAHCGKCGVGGTHEPEKGHSHDHGDAHDHGHAHAKAEVGKPAPDFALKDTEGKEHKLSDLKGKVVVLEWTNHTCPFVKRVQGEKLAQGVFATFKDKPVVWLAIDSSNFCADKADDIRAWIKKHEVTYPILLDAPGKVGQMYGAKSTPHMFVIDQKGNLAYSGAFDDNPHGDKETPRNYIAETVSALLNGSAVPVAKTKPYGCGVKYKK